jgi:hypothetical protein
MRRLLFTGIFLIGVAAIALVFAGTLAEAGSLKGEFRYMTSEARLFNNSLDVTYCSEIGTITFNGMGNARVVSKDRCIVIGHNPTSTERESDFIYTVDPKGNVTIAEADDPSSITHCQLVDSGKMLLCDAEGKDASVLQWNAIAVKQ